jgi:hypothetical protein
VEVVEAELVKDVEVVEVVDAEEVEEIVEVEVVVQETVVGGLPLYVESGSLTSVPPQYTMMVPLGSLILVPGVSMP